MPSRQDFQGGAGVAKDQFRLKPLLCMQPHLHAAFAFLFRLACLLVDSHHLVGHLG